MNDQFDDVASAASVPQEAEPMAFQEIPGAKTQLSSHRQRSRTVIRDAAAWEAFWQGIVANISPAPDAPVFDFDRQMVLAAAMGQRTSGGYAISIDSLFLSQGTVFALVTSVSPGPDCGAAAVMTAPVAAVVTDRLVGPTRFVERERVIDCG
jgi:hypothetical protein